MQYVAWSILGGFTASVVNEIRVYAAREFASVLAKVAEKLNLYNPMALVLAQHQDASPPVHFNKEPHRARGSVICNVSSYVFAVIETIWPIAPLT